MAPYRPAEVAKLLNVSVSTVKNYATQYSRYLSPGGGVVGQPRYFTAEDVRVLAFIADHSHHGIPHSEITARLEAGELSAFDWQPPTDAPQQPTDSASEPGPGQVALVLINRLQNDVDAAREDARQWIERALTAEARASRAEGMLEELRSQASGRPWYRRLFGG